MLHLTPLPRFAILGSTKESGHDDQANDDIDRIDDQISH